METLYYRKIAEIVLRSVSDGVSVTSEVTAAAEHAAGVGYDRKASIKKRYRKLLKSWMHKWCDDMEVNKNAHTEGESGSTSAVRT